MDIRNFFGPPMEARLFERLMRPLQPHLNHLEQAFDIPSSKVLPTRTKSIRLQIDESANLQRVPVTVYYRDICRLESGRWQIPAVPEEIEDLIYSYLRDKVTIRFEIEIANRFPYRAPKVKVTECSNPNYDIYTLVEKFNCEAQDSWSPALGLDKTLLILFSQILELIGYV